jgi:hypothetical protein
LPSGEICGEFTLKVSSDWSMVGVFDDEAVCAAAAVARARNTASGSERMGKLLCCWPKYTGWVHWIEIERRGCGVWLPAHPMLPEVARMTKERIEKSRDSAEGGIGKEGRRKSHEESRERHLDKTIEDSFPASDPPSTDPNPDGDD